MAAQLHVEKVPGGYAVMDQPGNPEPAPTDYRGTDRIARYLALAQKRMQNPAFDAQNPHFRNRYASLAAVRNAVIPVLAEQGIAVVQEVYTEDGQIACVTHLYHESGQSLTYRPLKLPVSKQDAQGFGSAATYARRYALMAVAGVVGDADDDAEQAVGRTHGTKEPIEPFGELGKAISPDFAMSLAEKMRAILNADQEEHVIAMRALDLTDELRGKNDEYGSAWKLMDSKERSAWKKYIDIGHKLAAADPTGRG